MYQEVDNRFDELMRERGLTMTSPKWPKHTHLDHIRDSGHFRFTRELFLHHVEQGNATRFLEMILSSGYSYHFKLKTITEQEIGFDRLTRAAFQALGSQPIPWYFSYRVRIGIM